MPTAEASPATANAAATLAALPDGVIDGGEIVLLVSKPSMWRPLFDSAPWLIAGVVVAGLLTWLNRPLLGFSLTSTTQLIILIAFARLGLAVVRWVPTWYILTNRRVIDVQGVRRPRGTARLLVEIRNTRISVSRLEKLTSLGTITFPTADADAAAMAWRSIHQPDVVHAKIRRAIEYALD
jgi:hypothetical protein